MSRHPRRLLRSLLSAAGALSLGAAGALAQTIPLEQPAGRLINFETAHILPEGRSSLQAGAHQSDPGTGGGTGSQVYYAGVDWAVTSNLQLSFSAQIHEDPPISPIAGAQPPTRFLVFIYPI